MFDILLFGVVWEGMVVVKGKVVDIASLTMRCCGVIVGSTGMRGCVINRLADNCQYAAYIARQLVGKAIYLYCYRL